MAEFPTYEEIAKNVAKKALDDILYQGKSIREWVKIIMEQEPSGDLISRQAVNILVDELARAISDERCCISRGRSTATIMQDILDIPSVNPQEPKTGHCKDCKWWKDSDGAFRRGIGAESQCPINREEVYEGNGYCFLFEPRESEDEE